ncbi:1-phosphofructokinase family hexose kinase [Actinomadura harenae]|uniref:1-phosphofructokinase family hexose kinase n=1 Tax=Actinomadura harenae TaxID=2483351 RepID=A0A3M2LMW8_9ACTN|nr:1-phosphofructokinase family hexose kinase [Actinomadura harenae]RMI38789.1 1-phosphofructokinase family hexose kinase [Actinomadura harenae]
MILTVTLNAALDVTYEVGALERGESHRVGVVRERAGGKGINVARVARALGCEVTATGFAGGVVGELIRDDLRGSGIVHDFVTVSGTSRRTLTVVETESGEATVLNEAGPRVLPEEWRAFLGHFGALAASASVVVLSGSLPPGVPVDAYAELARLAPGRVVLDADGTALTEGLRGRPDVVKPNADELTRATAAGRPVAERAGELRDAGAGTVLVSLGADGMLAVTPDGVWRAVPPEVVVGNPTGAGDAAVAATARALLLGRPWDELVRDAVALSAAAVAAPVAGDFDPDLYVRLLPEIAIEGLSCPS